MATYRNIQCTSNGGDGTVTWPTNFLDLSAITVAYSPATLAFNNSDNYLTGAATYVLAAANDAEVFRWDQNAITLASGKVIELGHASDTTISRVSAGIVAVEGVNLVNVSATQTLTNKTLTSPTLTTPILGTPASGTLTNCTGLPVAGGGTGASTAPIAIANLGHSLPTSFPGLTLWMDATTLTRQGSAEMADGTAIDAWRSRVKVPFDIADSGFTATTTARPLYKQNIQNTLPGVLFDGSNDLMTCSTGWQNAMPRNERTIFIVCKPTALVATGSGTTFSRPQLIGNVGQYDGISVSPSGSDNIFTAWDYDSVGARTASTGASVVSAMALVESWHEGGVLSVALNEGTPVTTTLREITTSGSTIQLGTSGSGAFYTGYIFEVLIYARVLSTIERNAVADYLRAKWNF